MKRPTQVKQLSMLVVIALAAAACGTDDSNPVNSDGTVPSTSATLDSIPNSDPPTAVPPTSDADTTTTAAPPVTSEPPIDFGGEPCDPDLETFIDAEFAFLGTVREVRGVIDPVDVDIENPDRPDVAVPTAWVTFNVHAWYTNDWGTVFNVWMPAHRAAVGDRIAVGGDARFVRFDGFGDQSGEVEFCTPADDPSGVGLEAWDTHFGSPVVAGAAQPEGDADPADLAAIDESEAAWRAVAGDSYSFFLALSDRGALDPSCRSQSRRVVVVDGAVVEAASLSAPEFACDSPPASLPSVEDLFDFARQVAGATEFEFRSKLDTGTVLHFWATDRSVETQAHVHGFSHSTAPTVVGWDDVAHAAADASTRWANTDVDHVLEIGIGGGERAHHNLTSTVIGGVVEVRDGDSVIDPETLVQPWVPYTVDGVFDLIDELDGQGRVVAVFDQETGAPTDLFFDPEPDWIDDELSIRLTISRLDSDGEPVPPTSDVERALRTAGADLVQFPSDLAAFAATVFCGTMELMFSTDGPAIAETVRCLSDNAGHRDGSAAVFLTTTPEGDPIVILWVVGRDTATIYTDSSRDSFAGGPFVWSQVVCDVELPLDEPPADGPANPYALLDC